MSKVTGFTLVTLLDEAIAGVLQKRGSGRSRGRTHFLALVTGGGGG